MDRFSLHTPEQISQTLAARIKALRLAKGWKQATLAERSGVSLGSLRRFESSGQVSLQHLLQLAFALNRRSFVTLCGCLPSSCLRSRGSSSTAITPSARSSVCSTIRCPMGGACC